jgi:hypothetical protein
MRDGNPISNNDIDQLLTDFFREAQPKPWPRMAPPESAPQDVTPVIPMRKRASSPGRFALAASVAFLAFTGIWLTGLAPKPTNGPGVNLNEGTADLLDKAPRRAPAPMAKPFDDPEPNTVRPQKTKNKN